MKDSTSICPFFYGWIPGLLALLLAGCASSLPAPTAEERAAEEARLPLLVNRLTWGINDSTLAHAQKIGYRRFIEEQLSPPEKVSLPPEIQAQIDAMTISRRSLVPLVKEMRAEHQAINDKPDEPTKIAAKQVYESRMNDLVREASTRSLLRDVYAPDQLREQLVWFWMNHFNLYHKKETLRAMVGDFEDTAIRPHALGHFRDLLRATAHHPAMLSYLDNDHNYVGHINENYAREIMELHTMGVGNGYTQKDVQELARVLTGLGVNYDGRDPKVPARQAHLLLDDGLLRFNPHKHDMGEKVFLGQTIQGGGIDEIDGVIDQLARQPATARFVSSRLATYFLGAPPSPELVDTLARAYQASDGEIATVLRTLFRAREFEASLGQGFKDPIHYVVSSVRLTYDSRPITNPQPMLRWLEKMGQPLYAHQTPEGYPLDINAWTSSGQMAMRFDIARDIGATGVLSTLRPDADRTPGKLPEVSHSQYYASIAGNLPAATAQALASAESPAEWNIFYLSAPAMMAR